MGDYVDVASRIAAVRGEAERHYPEGSFQPFEPFRIVTVGDKTFVAYVAAFYRTPDDPRPGVGAAWEPVPGKTNFTRDSELQNAETSAWGRALIAALAADTKKGIASADEVRSRSESSAPAMSGFLGTFNDLEPKNKNAVLKFLRERGHKPVDVPDELIPEVTEFIDSLKDAA